MVRETIAQWLNDHGLDGGEAELDKAEARYLESDRLTPKNSDTLSNLGHLCWMRASHYLRIGRDIRPVIEAGLAYLERGRQANPNEAHVYFNVLQLQEVAVEATLNDHRSPAPMIDAMREAIAAHNRINPNETDVDAFEAKTHVYAARAAAAAGLDPSAEYALAEKALKRAQAAEPTIYSLTAVMDIYVNRAEWLVKRGRSASAELTAAEAAIEKRRAIDQGDADTRIVAGTLALIRARAATKDPVARRGAATRARTELEAAVKANRFVEREVKPLLTEAETLAR